jgi:hypothetical protein
LAHARTLAGQTYLVQNVFHTHLTEQHIGLALGMQRQGAAGLHTRHERHGHNSQRHQYLD